MYKRGSGILCHISSLPSRFGIGDLGPGAYAFADFLCQAKQGYWQVLPVNPTNGRYAYSPFTSMSSCAGNTILISPEMLVGEGLLSPPEVLDHPDFSDQQVDYASASRFKDHLFRRAHARFKEKGAESHDYARFCQGQADWLEDHAFFTALSGHLGQLPLSEWPKELCDAKSSGLQNLKNELADDLERERFLQYIFYTQWSRLKAYCNSKAIQIIGDFPLFMNYDSADIWAHPEFFKVDENKRPQVLAGSPPDSFSAEGQLFYCAVYDWGALKQSGFTWWIRRFKLLFKLFDFVRIDHFRGLISYWEVPQGEQNALKGRWQPAAVHDLIEALSGQFPALPVIAEDLGTITAEVREAMALYGIPGMKVLLLAFEKEMASLYLPHHHTQNSVVYTGTHDVDTVMGWFQDESKQEDKKSFFGYLGREIDQEANWEFIKLAMMSVALTAIIPMQDVLGLGKESRMNTPGTVEGNWQWRFPGMDLGEYASRLARMTVSYGRAR